jgi:hypothetical protein
MTTMTRRRNFIVTPLHVEQLSDNYEEDMATWDYEEPSLYEDLVLAGYPLTNDESLGKYYIDLSVDPDDLTDVTVYTSGPNHGEHLMGPAAGLFLAWYARHVPDGEV